jgi:hypothetical protein
LLLDKFQYIKWINFCDRIFIVLLLILNPLLPFELVSPCRTIIQKTDISSSLVASILLAQSTGVLLLASQSTSVLLLSLATSLVAPSLLLEKLIYPHKIC